LTDSPTQTLPRLGTECPTCGAHADPGQLVCLECGTRLALDYRRPKGWKTPLLVILLVLAVAGAAFAITLIAVDDDSKDEVAASKAGKQTGAAPAEAKKQPARSSPRPASLAGIATWPSGRNGFTVVLLSAGDRASARKFAEGARKDGVKIGVLRTDDFSSLEKGFWLVFSGVYASREQAQRANARLGRRFSGAYPQFVNGAERR
jgi:septal ring-binding cell division protein DamX